MNLQEWLRKRKMKILPRKQHLGGNVLSPPLPGRATESAAMTFDRVIVTRLSFDSDRLRVRQFRGENVRRTYML
jgi:hypothetical protein